MRVLVVEDDPSLSLLAQNALEHEGYDVRLCSNGRDAMRLLRMWKPDIALLDYGLPDIRGRDLMTQMRKESRIPVIIVTANVMEDDRVASLNAGADDYVTKPFSIPELIARIRAVMRRSAPQPDDRPATLAYKDITLDRDLRQVRRGDEEIALTRTEFDILRVMLEGRGAVVTRDRLARAVWDRPAAAVAKPLDVHLSTLRKKLGDDARAPRYIVTVRGIGFRLAEA